MTNALMELTAYLNTPPRLRGATLPLNLIVKAKAEIERLEKQLGASHIEYRDLVTQIAESENKLDTARMELQRLLDIVYDQADVDKIERVLKETL